MAKKGKMKRLASELAITDYALGTLQRELSKEIPNTATGLLYERETLAKILAAAGYPPAADGNGPLRG